MESPPFVKNLLWRAPYGGIGAPVVQKGRVYFMTKTGSPGEKGGTRSLYLGFNPVVPDSNFCLKVAFPIFMFFIASSMNDDYKKNLLHTSSGLMMLGIAGALVFMGLIAIRKITTVKV